MIFKVLGVVLAVGSTSLLLSNLTSLELLLGGFELTWPIEPEEQHIRRYVEDEEPFYDDDYYQERDDNEANGCRLLFGGFRRAA